jgi:hypothetical protein
MGGAFIEVIGDTKEEVTEMLTSQYLEAQKLGLIDVRARIVEEEWPYTTPAGKEEVAPWGGVIWVHS